MILCTFIVSKPIWALGEDAIIHRSEVKYEILSDKKFKFTEKKKITVLNTAGDRHAQFYFFEDDFRDQRRVDISVVDGS